MRLSNQTLIFLAIIVFIVVCACGAAQSAATPPSAVEATQPAPNPTSVSVIPTAASEFTPQPALPERRRLTLEFPPQIRAGDSDVVRLTLEVDDLGNITPTAQIGGNVITGQVIEIPNLYESHHVIAEARFDIAGLEVRPSELISEPLSQGTSATFYWSIRPQEVGVYRGTIWLYLRFVEKQSGEESRNTVSAQIVEIKAVSMLGLSGGFARTTGVIGSVVGTVIGFPFIEDIIKFVFKRRNRRI